jgi:uridine phosphorylase
MYKELAAEDHQKMLRLGPDQLPDVVLLLGVFDVHAAAERFSRYLDNPVSSRSETNVSGIPYWLGTHEGVKVGLSACFGGPMAALFAHTWIGAGVKTIIQLGWYGALQPGTALGDVVVPRHAERQDGVSDWYLNKGILSDATEELASAISARLRARGIPVNEHAIYSTPALLAESREVIADWSRHGWHGVDMETAATFAVAKSLGARRAAALIRIDDLVSEEHSLAEGLRGDNRTLMRTRERDVMHAAIEAAAEPARAR